MTRPCVAEDGYPPLPADTGALREAVVEWADKISRVAETAARYHQVDVAVPLRYAVDDLRRLAALGSGTAPTASRDMDCPDCAPENHLGCEGKGHWRCADHRAVGAGTAPTEDTP